MHTKRRRIKLRNCNTNPKQPKLTIEEVLKLLAVSELNETALKVWLYLYSIRDVSGVTPIITYKELQDKLNKGRTSISAAIKQLKESDLIKIEKSGFQTGNQYKITLPKKHNSPH
ncbi:MAG: hypothetical protein O2970_11525 [Proteobacteria bacterium]|nr:hypothetical protein [Pseudomonadota bacterium]